ncbi:type I restriction-modification system subunit M [Mucilaginibacter sp. UYCu711]|uniref:type I restriction-modification system subunit M n=1 Tax=Mucilaginibacter sp. UYCu711 TaxID=3156339 RepID=UPI003D1A4D2E
MAIKKSELYSSLWASCDELRGGMDASQYKDYVLTLLFVKYISDKYKDQPFGAITVPEGASFDDMVALVGKPQIGDSINKKILNPIKEANKLNEFPDFADENKLGKGKDLIETVSNLVLIFNDPKLNFSGNNAEGDDILGDAYEFLMRHFATESGKSKGQFYTPAEVSRVLAKVIGINQRNSTTQTMAYDPTCGSGSLLLKVMLEAGKNIDLYGQEKESATANLARMNMILHGAETATIVADNTLSKPAYKQEDGKLKKFDYIVANPPFSLVNWGNGVSTDNDEFGRFEYGVPPEKNGDFAFLLHILSSLKSTGKAAVVLPHGVLFRGNAEGEIRKNLIKKGYIKGIIGLPPNLFYGTGIPACIIILDKENAASRKAVFMIDASREFKKDGNKNRLREQDIRKITDVFETMEPLPKYSRIVPLSEIAEPKNDYNLNIPRYIEVQDDEDLQDIMAHLHGGIPISEIDSLHRYWKVYPNLRSDLFSQIRPGYLQLNIPSELIKNNIFEHREFIAFNKTLQIEFNEWSNKQTNLWKNLKPGFHPKETLQIMCDDLLATFANNKLLDAYDIYEELMIYWAAAMQDDMYSISLDDWRAGNDWERLIIKGKKGKDGKVGKEKVIDGLEGIVGRMISPNLLIEVYLGEQWDTVKNFEAEIETLKAQLQSSELENDLENTVFIELDKVNLTTVKNLLKQRKKEKAPKEEINVIENFINVNEAIKNIENLIKFAKLTIEKSVIDLYPKLSEEEIKEVVINRKWNASLQSSLNQLQSTISRNLAQRIIDIADNYCVPLPDLEDAANVLEKKVKMHLESMGFETTTKNSL